jgi:carbonic anhydrase/acetyltransferase-like protein (isoleucine patch superfamily)
VPDIDPSAYVHPDAVVIGDVTLGVGASVWPGAVLRGDFGAIRIGARTSIQDGTIIHATETQPTTVGAGCVVGHNAHLEGCDIGDGALVGSMSAVLNGVTVGAGALIAAGAVVRPGTVVPPLAMAAGVPAKIRPDAVEPGAYERGAAMYVANAQRYKTELKRLD